MENGKWKMDNGGDCLDSSIIHLFVLHAGLRLVLFQEALDYILICF